MISSAVFLAGVVGLAVQTAKDALDPQDALRRLVGRNAGSGVRDEVVVADLGAVFEAEHGVDGLPPAVVGQTGNIAVDDVGV